MYWRNDSRVSRLFCCDAFTLVEVLISVALLGLFSSGALWTLSQANSNAALARLYTGAQVQAQNQVDAIMSKGPFNPQDSQWPLINPNHPPSDPDVYLKPGTYSNESVIVYSDPRTVANPLTITGYRTTTVVDTNLTVSGRSLNMYQATVVVTFTYRGKQHQVQLNAMRSSDVDGDS